MSEGADFERYLISKKIDSEAFRKAEPELWNAWKSDFDQQHPNSFTVQKLNMINPVRRKYTLLNAPESKPVATPPPVKVVVPRPGRPKHD